MKSMGQTAYDEAYRERQFSFIIKRDWAEIPDIAKTMWEEIAIAVVNAHIDARDAHD